MIMNNNNRISEFETMWLVDEERMHNGMIEPPPSDATAPNFYQ